MEALNLIARLQSVRSFRKRLSARRANNFYAVRHEPLDLSIAGSFIGLRRYPIPVADLSLFVDDESGVKLSPSCEIEPQERINNTPPQQSMALELPTASIA